MGMGMGMGVGVGGHLYFLRWGRGYTDIRCLCAADAILLGGWNVRVVYSLVQ